MTEYEALIADAQSPGVVGVLADWHEGHGDLALAAFLREQSTPLRARIASQAMQHLRLRSAHKYVTAEEVGIVFRCGKGTARLVLERMHDAKLLTRTNASNWHAAFYRLRTC